MLYASSWLLTAFAADFPLFFSSRVMDVVLTDRYLEPMMKARPEPYRPQTLDVNRKSSFSSPARHERCADQPLPGAHDEGALRPKI